MRQPQRLNLHSSSTPRQ